MNCSDGNKKRVAFSCVSSRETVSLEDCIWLCGCAKDQYKGKKTVDFWNKLKKKKNGTSKVSTDCG